jgi:outer membrane receptor for ferric coprogen and ferric-rhodotorulic acid
MISNFKEYYKLVDYLSQYTKKQLGLSMGVNNFVEIFDEHYYEDLRRRNSRSLWKNVLQQPQGLPLPHER